MGTEKKTMMSSRRATTDVGSLSQADAREEKIRRKKLATEHRWSSMPRITDDASSDADAAFEERPKRKMAAGGSKDLSSSLVARGVSAAEKVRRKLGMEGSSRRPSPDRLAMSMSSAPPDLERRMGDRSKSCALLNNSMRPVREDGAYLSQDESDDDRGSRTASMTSIAADAAFEERLKRKMAAGGSNNLSSSLIAHGVSAAKAAEDYEEKVMRKLGKEVSSRGGRPDHLSMSMPASSMPPHLERRLGDKSQSSVEAYEEKVRRKLGMEGSSRRSRPVQLATSMSSAPPDLDRRMGDRSKSCALLNNSMGPSREDSAYLSQDESDGEKGSRTASMTSIAADAAFEERLKRKMAAGGSNNLSSSLMAHGVSATKAAEDYEEKVMRKLGKEGSSRGGRPDHLSMSMTASSSSRGSSSTDSALKAKETHEEKVRRKLGRESSSRTRSRTTQVSSSMTALRNNDIMGGSKRNLSSSLRTTSDLGMSDESYEEKVRRKLVQQLGTESNRSNNPSSHRSSSMNDIGEEEKEEAERSGSRRPNDFSASMPNLEVSIEQSSLFNIAVVCFDELFRELQSFMRENENSLAVPVSHPSFLRILDALAAIGMEGLLTKRWDYQFAGVKAFKREHGDCLIPPTHPTLGRWATTQSEHYGRYEEHMPGPMTKKRFKKLKGVGFDEFVRMKGRDKGRARAARHSSRTRNSSRIKETIPEGIAFDERLDEEEKASNELEETGPVMCKTITFDEKPEKRVSNITVDSFEEVDAKYKDKGGASDRKPADSNPKGETAAEEVIPDDRALDRRLRMRKMASARLGIEASSDNLTLDQKLQLKKMENDKAKESGGVESSGDKLSLDQKLQMKEMANVKVAGSKASNDLTFEQKLERKKRSNQRKFMERGMKAHASSKKSKQKDRAAVAAELEEKRISQRSLRRGLSRRMSRKLSQKLMAESILRIQEEMGSDDDEDDGNNVNKNGNGKGLEPAIRRSSSASNLCPGSWECPNCSHINEPVGLNAGTSCQVCDAPKNKQRHAPTDNENESKETSRGSKAEKRKSLMLEDVFSKKKTQDDIGIESWSELDDAVAFASSVSTRHIHAEDMAGEGNVGSWSELDGALALAVAESVRHFDKQLMEDDDEECEEA